MNYYIEKHDMEIILDALNLLYFDIANTSENPTDRPQYTLDEVDGLLQSLDNSGEEAWDLK